MVASYCLLIAVAGAGLDLSLVRAIPSQNPTPHLVLDEDTVDFGVRLFDKEIEQTFVLKNDGEAPLELSGMKKSCGCLVSDDSATSIPPGAERTLKVGYKLLPSRPKMGTQSFTVSYETNDPKTPRFILTVRVVLADDIHIDPAKLTLSQIDPAKNSSKQIKVYRLQRDSIPSITEISSTNPAVSAVFVKEEIADGGMCSTYEIQVDSDRAEQAEGGALLVQSTSSRVPLVEVPLLLEARQGVKVTPGAVLLGELSAGKSVTKKLGLEYNSSDNLPLTATSTDPAMTCSLAPSDTPSKWDLQVSYSLSVNSTHPIREKIRVLDAKGTPLAEIPVYGTAK